MSPLRIAWVCEGGGRLGWGHVGRGRAVLEQAGAGSAMVMRRGRKEIAAWAERAGVAWDVQSWKSRLNPLDPRRSGFDAVVVDHYTLPPSWVARAGRHLPAALVDDWMRRRFDVPLLVNANIGARREDYPSAHAARWVLGAGAALLRGEVRQARRKTGRGPLRRIVITFGGSDPHGIGTIVARDLQRLPWFKEGGRVTLVLGASYAGPRPRSGKRYEVVQAPPDFIGRCAEADLVITGAGTTTYELAHIGTPFLPVATVDNQERIAAGWAAQAGRPVLSTSRRDWQHDLAGAVSAAATGMADAWSEARRRRKLVDGRGVARLIAALQAAGKR